MTIAECIQEDVEFDLNAPINPDVSKGTMCNGDIKGNMFCVPRAPGYPPRCILDEITYSQLYDVLTRIPQAKRDLQKVTKDVFLLKIAAETKLVVSPHDEHDAVAKRFNSNTLPMYTALHGNIDGSIVGKRLPVT